MIKFTLISLFLLLDTFSAHITLLPSARAIAERVEITKEDDRGLQDVCSQLVDVGEVLFGTLFGVGFDCECSSSGSTYTLNCQSQGEICCAGVCGTVKDSTSLRVENYEIEPVDEEVCVTFSAPADLAGQERCAAIVLCGDGSTNICSCEVDVDGQKCGECDICKQPTQSEPWPYAAVDCTMVPGFEDLPTDCESVNEFIALGGCSAAYPSAPPSTSAARPSTSAANPATTVMLSGFMTTIFVAVSFLLRVSLPVYTFHILRPSLEKK
jgi:hypothetical protein